jgi:hypothetical protein
MTIFTGLLLKLVAWVVEKNFSHLRGGEFFEGGSVASLADFVADVSRRCWFRRFLSRFLFGRPRRMANVKHKHTQEQYEEKSSHGSRSGMRDYGWLIALRLESEQMKNRCFDAITCSDQDAFLSYRRFNNQLVEGFRSGEHLIRPNA